MTVAQTIFQRVRDEFAKGSQRISKSAVLEWDISYKEDGKIKHANGDTKARKLRLLIESNYLGAEFENGQCYVVPAKGKPNATPNDTPEAQKMAPDASVEESKPKLRPEFIYDGKSPRPVGVKMVPL